MWSTLSHSNVITLTLAMQPGKESEALEHLDLAVAAVPKATVLSAQIHQRLSQTPGKPK